VNELSYFTDRAVRSDRVIYTPTIFAKDALVYLQEVGELTALKDHSSCRKDLNSLLFFVVKDGAGEVEYGGEVHQLTAGDCVWIDCRQPYCHRSSSDRLWTLEWVHFYGKSVEAVYEKYLERGGKNVFHTEKMTGYTHLLEAVQVMADSEDYIRDMRINEYLQKLLTLLMEETYRPVQESSSAKQENIQKVRDYLEAHYEERITLEGLAKQFYINKFYLTKLFKQTYGVTVNSYLMQIRITRAKQLLRFTDLSIELIGEKCGISDPNYFSRAFKKMEGLTPGRYRRMW
jgi:AraC family transcriptional regulator of arabinose operon